MHTVVKEKLSVTPAITHVMCATYKYISKNKTEYARKPERETGTKFN